MRKPLRVLISKIENGHGACSVVVSLQHEDACHLPVPRERAAREAMHIYVHEFASDKLAMAYLRGVKDAASATEIDLSWPISWADQLDADDVALDEEPDDLNAS